MYGQLSWRTIGMPANPKVHLVVDVDPELAAYARSFIPRSYAARPTRYSTHITAVREERVGKEQRRLLYDLNGMDVLFECGGMHMLKHNDVYWWLPARAPALLMIRKLLWLDPYTDLIKPPDGEEVFHITVGNMKGQ